jgi:hypothetical protein
MHAETDEETACKVLYNNSEKGMNKENTRKSKIQYKKEENRNAKTEGETGRNTE